LTLFAASFNPAPLIFAPRAIQKACHDRVRYFATQAARYRRRRHIEDVSGSPHLVRGP
jgi:hypothetical protein